MGSTHSEISSLLGSVGWIRALLTGPLATSVAVIAVALLGIRMLGGQLAPKSAARVLLGCFVLFGAPTLAAGLINATQGGMAISRRTVSPAEPVLPKNPPAFDPYAGAAVPIK